MGWRDQLQPASYKGVPFQVLADSQPAGQRTQVHEYPQRDLPLVESLGRKTNEIRMTAFVAGDDCLDQRDALLAVIWEAGSGELIHPWMGSITASVIECTYSHNRIAMGMVQFELVFVEGEAEPDYPIASKSPAAAINSTADNLLDSATDRFLAALDAIDLSQIRLDAVLGPISEAVAVVQDVYGTITDIIDTTENLISQVLDGPAAFANQLFSAIGGVQSDFAGFYSRVKGLSSIFGLGDKFGAISGLSDIRIADGQVNGVFVKAVRDLMQDAVAADTLRNIAVMPATTVSRSKTGLVAIETMSDAIQSDINSVDTIVSKSLGVNENRPPVADDLLKLNDDLSQAFWGMAVAARPDHYNKIASAKSAASKHLISVARQGINLTTINNKQPVPALLLAYRLYADAGLAADIVARNDIQHPGFIPATELQVPRG